MNILIEIETEDEKLLIDLTLAPKKFDVKTTLPANVVLMKVQPSRPTGRNNIFMLTFGVKVSPEILSNWIYEKLKDRATALRMDWKEIQIDKTEIEKVILKKIEKIDSDRI